MHLRKNSPRVQYRLQQSQRARDSVCLAERFPGLVSLRVNLAYFDAEDVNKTSEMKYEVNVHHAKSMFSLVCPNGKCVGGDFDLSEVLAEVVAGRRKQAAGEMRCQGWHKKAKLERAPCQVLLRYKLCLGYG